MQFIDTVYLCRDNYIYKYEIINSYTHTHTHRYIKYNIVIVTIQQLKSLRLHWCCIWFTQNQSSIRAASESSNRCEMSHSHIYLWYWAWRNWNSSLILSQDSATVNLKPGWPGWWGAWKKKKSFMWTVAKDNLHVTNIIQPSHCLMQYAITPTTVF